MPPRSHGKTGSQVYKIWDGMVRRCTKPRATGYEWYGGRGIKVCDQWQVFAGFYADMGDPPTPLHTLDRIDMHGDYSPENCRWVTRHDQMRNQRRNRWVTYNGETKCVRDWADQFGLSHHCLLRRLYKYGWSVEQSLTTASERQRV